MSGTELLAAGMSIFATALYGYTLVFTKVHLKDASPMAISAGTLLLAALALAPIAPTQAPELSTIPALAWMALLGLAFVSTTVAFLFYYRLIADIGPVKASTVTLLVPVFGMIWGVIFLGEPLTAGRIAGCAIILSGCALILGWFRRCTDVRRAKLPGCPIASRTNESLFSSSTRRIPSTGTRGVRKRWRNRRRPVKPILLSVGYSACHWCHVMAHESFEDADVARVMNELFVNVKVDREERPDIDQIYQVAQALLTQRNGGWP
jgi:uncharacterized membrane protein